MEPKVNSLAYDGEGKLKIDLSWRVGSELSKDTPYWTFVHFVHPKSGKHAKIHFRLTTWPKKPTPDWKPGQTYPLGQFDVPIPKDAIPGAYEVRIGMYSPKERKSPKLRIGTNHHVVGKLIITKEGGKVTKAVFKPE